VHPRERPEDLEQELTSCLDECSTVQHVTSFIDALHQALRAANGKLYQLNIQDALKKHAGDDARISDLQRRIVIECFEHETHNDDGQDFIFLALSIQIDPQPAATTATTTATTSPPTELPPRSVVLLTWEYQGTEEEELADDGDGDGDGDSEEEGQGRRTVLRYRPYSYTLDWVEQRVEGTDKGGEEERGESKQICRLQETHQRMDNNEKDKDKRNRETVDRYRCAFDREIFRLFLGKILPGSIRTASSSSSSSSQTAVADQTDVDIDPLFEKKLWEFFVLFFCRMFNDKTRASQLRSQLLLPFQTNTTPTGHNAVAKKKRKKGLPKKNENNHTKKQKLDSRSDSHPTQQSRKESQTTKNKNKNKNKKVKGLGHT